MYKYPFILILVIVLISSCDTGGSGDKGCRGIEERRSGIWAKNERKPIDLSDMISTYTASDGSDHARCMFNLSCDDVCPYTPVKVEINYRHEDSFPGDSEYEISDMILEAWFREFKWNDKYGRIDTNNFYIPLFSEESGKGSANVEYSLSGPFKADNLYASIRISLVFSIPVKDPGKPTVSFEALESIISRVEIGIEYEK